MHYIVFTDIDEYEEYKDTDFTKELRNNVDIRLLPLRTVFQGKHYEKGETHKEGNDLKTYYWEYKVIDIEQFLKNEW